MTVATPMSNPLGSPTTAAIEAKIHLSLDDLIKQRKKENKGKKRETIKKEKSPTTPMPKAKAKEMQGKQRRTLMNKKRGIPVQQQEQIVKAISSKRKSAMPPKAKTQIKKDAMPVDVGTKKSIVKRPAATNNSFGKKRKSKQVSRSFRAPSINGRRRSTSSGNVQRLDSTKARQVVRTSKGRKLKITLQRSKSDVRRAKKKVTSNFTQRTVLPGKIGGLLQKKMSKRSQMAAKVVKRVQPKKIKARRSKVVHRNQPIVRKL